MQLEGACPCRADALDAPLREARPCLPQGCDPKNQAAEGENT